MSTKVSQIKVYKNGAWQDITKVHDGSGWKNFRGIYSGGIWYELSICQKWNLKSDCYLGGNEYSTPNKDIKDFIFNSNGTKIYMLNYSNNEIQEFLLDNAWDLSSYSKTAGIATSYTTGSTGTAYGGIYFKPDGTKLYEISYGDSFWFTFHEINLSTAWDLSTASRVQDSGMFIDYEFANHGTISGDGKKGYLIGSPYEGGASPFEIWQYSFGTDWDVSTMNLEKKVTVPEAQDQSLSMYFKPDGSKLYIGDASEKIFEYSLSTPWDVESKIFKREFSTSYVSNHVAIRFKPDGNVLYTLARDSHEISNIKEFNYQG